MPKPWKKETRLENKGYDPYRNPGRFRHFSRYHLKLRKHNWEGYLGIKKSIKASRMAYALEEAIMKNGMPFTPEEFDEIYKNTNEYDPSVSSKTVISRLPAYLGTYINILGKKVVTEPYFIRILNKDQMKRSLRLINGVEIDTIPKIVLALDTACREGVCVDRVLGQLERNDVIKETVVTKEMALTGELPLGF